LRNTSLPIHDQVNQHHTRSIMLHNTQCCATWLIVYGPLKSYVGFEVFTAVVMKSIIFWDMTPRRTRFSPRFTSNSWQRPSASGKHSKVSPTSTANGHIHSRVLQHIWQIPLEVRGPNLQFHYIHAKRSKTVTPPHDTYIYATFLIMINATDMIRTRRERKMEHI
jgi:hypothetical protein